MYIILRNLKMCGICLSHLLYLSGSIYEFITLWGCCLPQIRKWNRKGKNTDNQQKFLIQCCKEK